MAPLKDYAMKIYGNGKLVVLERVKASKEMNGKPFNIQGKSPLIRNGKIKGISTFSLMLYLPEDSNEFVIIRK